MARPAYHDRGSPGWQPGLIAAREWYDGDAGRQEIADVIRYLDDTCQLGGVDEALYIVEKPWKFSAEREQMLKARGRVWAA